MIAHIVRSYDGAGVLRCTLHTSLADAQAVQGHRLRVLRHTQVLLLVVEAVTILLARGGSVVIYREVVPAKRSGVPVATAKKVGKKVKVWA